MQIVIDGRMILPQMTGLGRYLFGLVGALRKIPCEDHFEMWIQSDLPAGHPIWRLANQRLNLRRVPINYPDECMRMSKEGINVAPQFSYECYLLAIDEMFFDFYGKSPHKQDSITKVRDTFIKFPNSNLDKYWYHGIDRLDSQQVLIQISMKIQISMDKFTIM